MNMANGDRWQTWVVGGGKQPTPDAGEFGRLVRWLRESLGLSLTELGAATGISQGFLSGIEHGKQAPSKEYTAKLLKFFSGKGALELAAAEGREPAGEGAARPDFEITDPRTGGSVAIELKAKRKGDNQAHFDQLAAYWSSTSANRMAPTPPGLQAILVPTAGLGEDSMYGSVVRRLAGADRERLMKVARFLDRLDREFERPERSDASENGS